MLSDEGMVQWHRHSCLPRGTKGLCVFAEPKTRRIAHTGASLASEILIANPRLKFELSCTKESLLEIPNRKYIAIFYFATTDQPTFPNFQELTSRPQILIANARLEFSVNHTKDSPLKIPNRERIAILHLRSPCARTKRATARIRRPRAQPRLPFAHWRQTSAAFRSGANGFQCIIPCIRIPRGASWLRTKIPRCGFLYVAGASCAAICSDRRMAALTQPSFVRSATRTLRLSKSLSRLRINSGKARTF